MKFKITIVLLAFLLSCKVVFIAGYDPIIESTATKIQNDFNVHFIKLQRTISDSNPNNHNISNFQDYYDHMNADLITLRARSKYLGKKGTLVLKEINNIDNIMHVFENLHKRGFTDSPDDKRDIQNGINSAFDALIKLQEELKPKK